MIPAVTIRPCIDDLEHSNGVGPKHGVYIAYQQWLLEQKQPVQDLAAEFNYGLCMRFKDGRYWVCGYIPDGVYVSPLCPQCHGDKAAGEHSGAKMMDPTKLREMIAKH